MIDFNKKRRNEMKLTKVFIGVFLAVWFFTASVFMPCYVGTAAAGEGSAPMEDDVDNP